MPLILYTFNVFKLWIKKVITKLKPIPNCTCRILRRELPDKSTPKLGVLTFELYALILQIKSGILCMSQGDWMKIKRG